MTKSLGSMKVEDVVSRIGDTVITKELGGDIFIANLHAVNLTDDGLRVRSIAVTRDDSDQVYIWPTQWHQAVFV